MRIFVAIPLMLIIGTGISFGQSKADAQSTKETEIDAKAQNIQKVDEMRKVVRTSKPLHKAETQKEIQFDEKGGAIIPGASKGIQQTRVPTARVEKGSEQKTEATRTNSPAPTKDLKSRRAATTPEKKGSGQ